MTRISILSLAGPLILCGLALPADAQRVDSRVGGSAAPPQAVRPYSAPLNPTVTRQAPVGAVQARIGPNGQVMTDPAAPPPRTSGLRTTGEPQLMRGLAPAADPASAPAVRPAVSSPLLAETAVAPRRKATKHAVRKRYRRR